MGCPACGDTNYAFLFRGHSCVNQRCRYFDQYARINGEPPEQKKKLKNYLLEDLKTGSIIDLGGSQCFYYDGRYPSGLNITFCAGKEGYSEPANLLKSMNLYSFLSGTIRGISDKRDFEIFLDQLPEEHTGTRIKYVEQIDGYEYILFSPEALQEIIDKFGFNE